MDRVISKNGVPVRLTNERWLHIVENHDDVAGHYDDALDTIENPQWILRGYRGALIAVRALGKRRYFCVVYKELGQEDGFVITAYITSRINRRAVVWREKS